MAEPLPEAEEPIYPNILAKVPGLVLESDLTDEDDAVSSPARPTFEDPTEPSEITELHGQFTGVDNDIFFHVTSPTGIEDPIVARITPPNTPSPTSSSLRRQRGDQAVENAERVSPPQTNLGEIQFELRELDEDEANVANALQLGRGGRIRTPPDYY